MTDGASAGHDDGFADDLNFSLRSLLNKSVSNSVTECRRAVGSDNYAILAADADDRSQ
jgi:hypothetical protein